MKLLVWLSVGSFLVSCIPYSHPMQGKLDSCNFHIGQYGVALRWDSLPVPIVFNNSAMNQNSIDATVKVVDEWNHIWSQETGGHLFEVLGIAQYPDVKSVFQDEYNSVSLVDSRTNRELSDGTNSKFLASSTQGVTRIVGRRSFMEGDILLNDDDFDFYYGEDKLQVSVYRDIERSLSSTTVPSFNIFEWFKKVLFFWKKQSTRQVASKRIPSHLIDFESLIAHEMGHLLGLGHLETSGSIMRSRMRPGVTRRGLTQIELNSLKCGYPSQQ